jgi:hypothetical protein
MNNSRRPSKDTQLSKLPKTAKELKELQKAITESLKQITDKELEDCEPMQPETIAIESDSEEELDDDFNDEHTSDHSSSSSDSSQPETIAIESDSEEELDDDFNDEHTSDHSSSSSDSGQPETIAIESDPEEELDDDSNDEHTSDHSSSSSDTGGLSKDLNFSNQDTSNEKNKCKKQYNPDDNSENLRWEKTQDSEEEPEEPDLSNTSDADVEAELKGAGKITPRWYSDADRGLLRRRMGVKADLPLQEQNAIVRTLRKLVRMKCGSDLNKPWSTYGRIVQNRMITSMYNAYHTRCS